MKSPLRHAIGGWEFKTILAMQSGLPFHVTSTDRSNTANTFGGRPNRLCNGNFPADQRTSVKWFDTSCFAEPALNTFGNGGVHYLDTDGNKTQDIGLCKNFNFTESKRLQFRYEAFNLWNNTNYNRPGNNVSAPPTFGRVTAAQPARAMQLALKLYF